MKNLFNFDTETITTNTTVYAKWIRSNFTFIFNSKGGTEIALQTIIIGEKAKKPTDPTRDNYLFKGWYKEEAFTNIFDFTKETITMNTIIYAKWEKIGKLTFSTTSVASSVQLEMSSNLEITNIGAVIRLATEAAPTKAEAQASKGYVSLSIDADSTRKFSISQHYTSNFVDGLTLDDVLAPNTNYKLYLFFESNAIASTTLIEGATLTDDTIILSFATTNLPLAGDAIWNEKFVAKEYVASLNEYHFMETQTGVIVAYFQIPFKLLIHGSSIKKDNGFIALGTYNGGKATPAPNFYYDSGVIMGYSPENGYNYHYVVAADKFQMIKTLLRLVYTHNNGIDTTYFTPISRY